MAVAPEESERLAYSPTRDDFAAKTLRLMKLARAALIYLPLAVHREERLRAATKDNGKITVPMQLDRWEDEWKQ